ncbi:MAG TPA: RagB/SusD family nutrient uptake outer membrane protein [Bacteroidetes bacterium]|nr:RagB/SusD family nutrient uptake outer membrane protein [Arcobacter sp.]HHH52843.1 RagB/SusD family nutrient uptake outer membrane protein [Bacteroidota bacterium]
MKTLIKIIFVLSILITSFTSCHKDLDVKYLNLPDRETALKNPEDVYGIAKSGFYNWYMTQNTSLSMRMAMWVAADNGTCSWANSGMWHLSDEPRKPFNNDPSYTYAFINQNYYAECHANLSQMNEVLQKLNEGMQIGYNGQDTKLVRANAYMIQGLTLGYLALIYDKAYIVTEYTDPKTVEASPYTVVMDSAIAKLDKAIELMDRKSYKIPADWISGNEFRARDLANILRNYAARFLVSLPRNKAENDQIDWNRVLKYAEKGYDDDFKVYMDGVNWVSYFRHYTVRPGWARIDCRVINLMDPSYPSRFPSDGHNPPEASSSDSRLTTDFSFNSTNNMKPERGYVHYSNYEYTRYPLEVSTQTGDAPIFLKAELDMIKAEAYLKLGDKKKAIDIINAGSRSLRGHLNPLPDNTSEEDVYKAIFYERDIELIQTGFGIAFFDMRRRDFLQEGTLLHFPIPGKELNVLQLPYYTYGGVENADGINVSNGGWDK